MRRQGLAKSGYFQASVVVLANEVWNYFDVVKVKDLSRRLFQIVGNCSDTVRLNNAITRDWQVGSVCADECNVGSMQRRNHGQASPRLQRLACENRTDRMRNGVVNVQEIEVLFLGDCRHLRSQCERVRLMLKQRIRHHLDFMETHVLVELRQSRWQCRGDEMN